MAAPDPEERKLIEHCKNYIVACGVLRGRDEKNSGCLPGGFDGRGGPDDICKTHGIAHYGSAQYAEVSTRQSFENEKRMMMPAHTAE